MAKQLRLYLLYEFLVDATFIGAVLVPFFTQFGHLTTFQIQLLQSWFAIWIFLLEIPTGAIADKFGRKWSLVLGSLVNVVAVLIYGSIPHFGVFLFSEWLFAMGVALRSGANEAWLYDTLKTKHQETQATKYFGLVKIASLSGILLSSIAGSWIADRWGVNIPMLAASIPFSLAAIIAIFLVEPPKDVTTPAESDRYLTLIHTGLSSIKNNKALLWLMINSIGVATTGYFAIWFYQPLLTQLQLPIATFGWFHALLVISELIIASQFIRLTKILGGANQYLWTSAIVVMISALAVAIFPRFIPVIGFIMITGGVGLTRNDYLTSHIHRHIQSTNRATIASSVSMFRRLAQAVFNPLIGFIADLSFPLALGLVGLLPTISLLSQSKIKKLVE